MRKAMRITALLCSVFLIWNISVSADYDTYCENEYDENYDVSLDEYNNAVILNDVLSGSDGLVNVAAGKSVTAKLQDGKAIGITDGDTTTAEKATETKHGAWTYWSDGENYAIIDLNAVYSISQIKGYFGFPYAGTQKPDTGFTFLYSLNGVDYNDIVKVTDSSNTIDYVYTLDEAVNARYIKLIIAAASTARAVRVREVEVYGADEPMMSIMREANVNISASNEDGVALGLIDGDTVSADKATANAKGAWTYSGSAIATIDLNGEYSIKQIDAYFGDATGANKPKSFTIETSTDGVNFKTAAFEDDSENGYNNNYSKKYNNGVNAGYVRITINSLLDLSKTFIVREMEIYGVQTSYPIVSNIEINGLNSVGSTLMANYDYIHTADLPQGDTQINWYRLNDNGDKTFIKNTNKYTVSDDDMGYSLICGVIPVDENGNEGDEVLSGSTEKINGGTSIAVDRLFVGDDGICAFDFNLKNIGNNLTAMVWTYSGNNLIDYKETEIPADGAYSIKTEKSGSNIYAVTIIADTISGKPIYYAVENGKNRPQPGEFDNTEIAVKYDAISDTYTLCGALDAKAAYFTIEDKDGNIIQSNADQTVGDKFYKEFSFPSGAVSGDYVFKIYFLGNAKNEVINIHYSSVQDKKIAFDDIKNATNANEFAKAIYKNMSILETGDKYVENMDVSQLENVCENMYKNTYTYENSKVFYEDLRYNAALYVLGCGGTNAYDAAGYYSDILNFENAKMYKQYTLLKHKEKVFGMFAETPKNVEDAVDMFNGFVLLQMINEAESYGKIVEYIDSYKDVITFDLAVYNSSDIYKTCLYLFSRQDEYTSMTQLANAIISAKGEQTDDNTGKVPPKRGNGGGGGTVKDSIKVTEDTKDNNIGTYVPAFADVGKDYWAAEYIKSLKERNIISGDEQGNFNPENDITREEFTKMLVLAAGLYNENAICGFYDVQSCKWAESYIGSAVEAGIINGVDNNTFGVGEKLTRQDMAVMVYRIFGDKISTGNMEFTDAQDISEYAKQAVAALANDGVINGFEDGEFKPFETARRSQCAKLIYAVTENIK